MYSTSLKNAKKSMFSYFPEDNKFIEKSRGFIVPNNWPLNFDDDNWPKRHCGLRSKKKKNKKDKKIDSYSCALKNGYLLWVSLMDPKM